MDNPHLTLASFAPTMPYRDRSPYPGAEVTGVNHAYAQALFDGIAGGGAPELSAVSQYLDHYLTMGSPYLVQLELGIALVEMHHLSLVGEVLKLLGGGNLHLQEANRLTQVAHCNNPNQKLKRDIRREEETIIAYHVLKEEIKDPKVQRILERILLDERLHLRLFQEALSRQAQAG